jgi:hypothetical protein
MKSTTLNPSRRSRRLPLGLFLGASLLCALATPARAQEDPSGTWDFVISGSQQGVAFLTFEKDFSINGFEIITSYTPPVTEDGRGGTENDRDPSVSATLSNQVLIGFTPVSGTWNFDLKGRTIGFLNEGEEAGGDLALSASFIATVRGGRRLTMKVTDSPNPERVDFKPRHRVYKGIPLQPNDDISGEFFANGVHNSETNGAAQKFTEFYTLTNFVSAVAGDPSFLDAFPVFASIADPEGDNGSANAYFMTGHGPGYTNWGLALFSAQRKLAIVSVMTDTVNSNSLLRSLSGNFKVGSGVNGAGRLFGTDDVLARISYRTWRY